MKQKLVQVLGSILFPDFWNVESNFRVPASIWDLEVTLGPEVMHAEIEDKERLSSCHWRLAYQPWMTAYNFSPQGYHIIYFSIILLMSSIHILPAEENLINSEKTQSEQHIYSRLLEIVTQVIEALSIFSVLFSAIFNGFYCMPCSINLLFSASNPLLIPSRVLLKILALAWFASKSFVLGLFLKYFPCLS